MEPHGRNNAPANEWTFDGGLNDDNENDEINNNQQEKSGSKFAISKTGWGNPHGNPVHGRNPDAPCGWSGA